MESSVTATDNVLVKPVVNIPSNIIAKSESSVKNDTMESNSEIGVKEQLLHVKTESENKCNDQNLDEFEDKDKSKIFNEFLK